METIDVDVLRGFLGRLLWAAASSNSHSNALVENVTLADLRGGNIVSSCNGGDAAVCERAIVHNEVSLVEDTILLAIADGGIVMLLNSHLALVYCGDRCWQRGYLLGVVVRHTDCTRQ